jgi:F0F1-type ATP synthase assembly protein I
MDMSYCQKCGSKVREEMSFCPNCGAALKAVQPTAAAPPAPSRAEKEEKREKHEKGEKREKEEKDQREKREKTEKHEKRGYEYGFAGTLVGGLILILLGLMFYIALTTTIGWGVIGAFCAVIIGIIIIIGAIYAATMASRRHPAT